MLISESETDTLAVTESGGNVLTSSESETDALAVTGGVAGGGTVTGATGVAGAGTAVEAEGLAIDFGTVSICVFTMGFGVAARFAFGLAGSTSFGLDFDVIANATARGLTFGGTAAFSTGGGGVRRGGGGGKEGGGEGVNKRGISARAISKVP